MMVFLALKIEVCGKKALRHKLRVSPFVCIIALICIKATIHQTIYVAQELGKTPRIAFKATFIAKVLLMSPFQFSFPFHFNVVNGRSLGRCGFYKLMSVRRGIFRLKAAFQRSLKWQTLSDQNVEEWLKQRAIIPPFEFLITQTPFGARWSSG